MTYTILARDSEANQMGIAVQSHHISAGAHVIAAEPGVGVMAIQSYADRRYAQEGLEALRQGMSAEQTIRGLIEAHPHGESRAQVSVLPTGGPPAVHTGVRCVENAGHLSSGDVAILANMVRSESVWPAMLTSYVAGPGDLAERLLSALEAGEGEGGDWRGRQSAALRIVPIEVGEGPMPVVDLRVDDHHDPLGELRRLDRLRRASETMGEAFAVACRGQIDKAIELLDSAQEAYGSENPEPVFWSAVLLTRAGRAAEAAMRIRAAGELNAGWLEFFSRLPKADLLPHEPGLVREVLDKAGGER